jgi:hypothetical protein
LASEARTNSVLRSELLARKYNLALGSVSKALKRQQERGLVEQLSERIYINKVASGFSPKDVVNELQPNAYVSLESALLEWGVSSQSPVALTCVSLSKTRTVKTSSVYLLFRKLKSELYWGFIEKKTRYSSYKIAEPEKALLDWIYFQLRDGLPVSLDEHSFERLSLSRLKNYAEKYPSTVRVVLLPAMLEKSLMGQLPPRS